MHFSLDFLETNKRNPDQTASKREQSDLGSYCLQYRLPKKIGKQEEQMTKDVTGRLRVNTCVCNVTCFHSRFCCIVDVCIDALCPSQQYFSHVGMVTQNIVPILTVTSAAIIRVSIVIIACITSASIHTILVDIG